MSIKEKVLVFQELTNNAWPAKEYFFVYGWILRFSNGFFSRANSVLPLHYFGSDIEEDIHTVERIYRNKGLNVIFQIPDYTMPLNLDSKLENLGYNIKSPTTVLVSVINTFRNIELLQEYNYTVSSDEIDRSWLNANHFFSNQTHEKRQAKEAIIGRISIPKKIYFTMRSDEKIVGVTLGVLERGILGIYSFVIDPKLRRKNLGSSLMNYVINWCRESSIYQIYLQVEKDNIPALGLYKKIGFQSIYSYHYRIKKIQ
ncbi:MAG: GNAT family N-acetyltransferase [Candidatus Hodarchaeota archaeon]